MQRQSRHLEGTENCGSTGGAKHWRDHWPSRFQRRVPATKNCTENGGKCHKFNSYLSWCKDRCQDFAMYMIHSAVIVLILDPKCTQHLQIRGVGSKLSDNRHAEIALVLELHDIAKVVTQHVPGEINACWKVSRTESFSLLSHRVCCGWHRKARSHWLNVGCVGTVAWWGNSILDEAATSTRANFWLRGVQLESDASVCLCPCPHAPADVAANSIHLAIIVQHALRQGSLGGRFFWNVRRHRCAGKQVPGWRRTFSTAILDLAEFKTDGFFWFQGAQFAIDTTMVSPFRRDGTTRRGAARRPGVALEHSPRIGGVACRIGCRDWSVETAEFFRCLAKAKADSTVLMQNRVKAAWLRRWSSILACSAVRAFAWSLLEASTPQHRFQHPFWAGGFAGRPVWLTCFCV